MHFLCSDFNNYVYQQVFDILFLKSSLEPWTDITTSFKPLIHPALQAYCSVLVEMSFFLLSISPDSWIFKISFHNKYTSYMFLHRQTNTGLCVWEAGITFTVPMHFWKLIEIKIKFNFYFHTTLWCLKRSYKGL